MARTPDRRSDSGKTGSEDLARIVRERRKALGMSRQELADASGIPYPTIAQIETAYRGVSPARLGVIARVLGLDPKELYDVLASDSADAALAEAAERPPAVARSRIPAGKGSWHANPRFAAAMPMAAAAPAAARPPAEPSVGEVVGQVVELLVSLPDATRMEALARVQSQLLERIVTERLAAGSTDA